MKKLILSFAMIGAVMTSFAQQRAQFTQYMANNYLLNPAVAGTEDFVDIALGYRTQWVGFEDAPVTYYITAHSEIGKDVNNSHMHHKGEHKNWHGVGLMAYNDVTGPTSRAAGYLSYSYNLGLTKYIRMSVGTFVGFQQFTVDGSMLEYSDVDTENTDPIGFGLQRDGVPDLSLGTWVYSKDFYAGLSVTQLLQNQLNFEGEFDKEDSKLFNHYFLTAGVRMPMNEEWTFVPSFMLKAVTPAPVSVDLNAKVKYSKTVGKNQKQDIAWGGISYRGKDSFAALVGVTVAQLVDVSYSFDLTTSDLRLYNNGTHEVIVRVKIPIKGHLVCPSRFW